MAKRRTGWGSVRKLSSGRWQARYPSPDELVTDQAGRTRPKQAPAPHTFETRKQADTWLSHKFAGLVDPTKREAVTFGEYAELWLANREIHGRQVKQRTYEHDRDVLDRHILATFKDRRVDAITVEQVEAWYAELGRSTGRTMRAHAYAQLRTILNKAVRQRKIDFNPCAIPGGGTPTRESETRIATAVEVDTIAANMPERLRLMVRLAAWGALRFGELAELRRKDVDLTHGELRITRAVVFTKESGPVVGDPKSRAGKRVVAFPRELVAPLRAHLAKHCQPGPNGLLFPGEGGGHLRPSVLYAGYYPAREAAGRKDLRFHDLRHTGISEYAATPGVTQAELMRWSGHTTMQISLRYQHPDPTRARELIKGMPHLTDPKVTPMQQRRRRKAS